MAKHIHQPIEDWLLSGEPLGPDQSLDLQEHLDSCEQCNRLSVALHEIEVRLRAAPEQTPTPGFASRWQARLTHERRWQQRRQNLFVLSFSVGGAALTLLILGILFVPLLRSPLSLWLTVVYQLASMASLTSNAALLLGKLFRTMFSVVPPTSWIGLGVAAGSLCILWIVALNRLAFQRRVS